jgi:hypothetical protein
LSAGAFQQNWDDASLISSTWDTVSNVVGYASTDGAVSLLGNRTNPSGLSNGGVAEFEDLGTVALQPTGTLTTEPNLVIDLDTRGISGATVAFNARDIDGSIDNADQEITLQYRVGNTGTFVDVTGYTQFDATTGPSLADLVTAVSASLPVDAIGQPLVQVKIASLRTGGSNEWVGIDDIAVTPTVSSSLPAWMQPGSAATWDGGTKTLTVTGAASIVADPGSDEPMIVANGAAAQVTVAPVGTDRKIHVGGVTLTGGADLSVSPIGVSRSHENHIALVVGTSTAAATFSIDAVSGSHLDLADNDLILIGAGAAGRTSAADLVASGRNSGAWDGGGLISSAAAASFAANGFDSTTLGVVLNGELPNGAYPTFDGQSVGENDVLVKYTYGGDIDLSGHVDGDDYFSIDSGVLTPGATGWINGDVDQNGSIDGDDYFVIDSMLLSQTSDL